MIVVDSSFLVSLFLQEDENHLKAEKIFGEKQGDELLLPESILFETLTVLNYKGGISKAREAHDKIAVNMRISIVSFREEERAAILDEFFVEAGKLSAADASVVYLARRTDAEVLTFDTDMRRTLAKKQIG